jgi:hypothetical protein
MLPNVALTSTITPSLNTAIIGTLIRASKMLPMPLMPQTKRVPRQIAVATSFRP